MATFGGYTFFSIRNAVKMPGIVTERIMRADVEGVGFKVDGLRGEPTEVETWTMVDSSTTAGNCMNSYTAMRSGTYSMTDDYGRTRSGIYVHDVQEIGLQVYGYATSNIYGKLMCRWILEATV